MYGCKHIRHGHWCPHGCTRSYTVCHQYARGRCEWASHPWCDRGYHLISDPPPPRDPPPPQVDPTRVAFRELGLNEDGVNVSRRSVEAVFKVRVLQTHPDHFSENMQAQKSAEFRKVAEARDHLLAILDA